MSVAVVIVNYKTYEALDRCLHSLRPYLRSGDEVLVVDCASSGARASEIRAAHPGVALLPFEANLGFSAGVNRGVAASRASLLLLLNPDAMLEGPVVERLSDYLEGHPDVGLVAPRVLNLDGSVQPTARRFPGVSTSLGGRSTWLTRRFPDNWFSRLNLPGRDARLPIDVDWLSGVCLMTPRRVFDEVGGFDEAFFMYWEDADYGKRLANIGLRRVMLPDVTVRHEGGVSAALDVAPTILQFHQSAYRYFLKHASGPAKLAAPAVWAALRLRAEFRRYAATRAGS